MDYKEEYEAMVKRCRELHESGNALTKQQMEIVCPQLKESEDERIRKEIICELKIWRGRLSLEGRKQAADKITDEISWLEKQKEQNLIMANSPQIKGQKPAWSEEDEEMLNGIIERGNSEIPKGEYGLTPNQVAWLETRFKSLRPQFHWKPSEEQMRELKCVISGCSYETSVLVSLENDLKKLIEL